MWPLRDLNPREKPRETPVIQPERALEEVNESPRLATVRDEPTPVETATGAEPTDSELERAIVEAVTMGLGDVARTLAVQLEQRRPSRAGNIVPIGAHRHRRT